MLFEYLWAMPNQWTFEIPEVQTILYSIINKHKRILIPFAGQFRFPNSLFPKDYTYIDIDPTRPQPCIYGDCIEVMSQRLNGLYDLIISDPPFCSIKRFILMAIRKCKIFLNVKNSMINS